MTNGKAVLAGVVGALLVATGVAVATNAPGIQQIQGFLGGTPVATTDTTLTNGSAKVQLYDGSNTLGSLTNPVRIDPTGTTPQPVSGSVSLTGSLPAFAFTPTFNLGGGNIGNTAFGISGTLPPFASTPSFNIAGGSISNTSFGISGTLPAFAVNPTVILGGGASAIGSISNTAFTANAGTNLNTSLLALESGGNLAAIKTDTDKIPAQGQALAAGSWPVVLTALQLAALTPPTTINANQGSANATPWVGTSDGTNTAKVQPGSTTPVAGDKATTVSLSPNGAAQPLPTGAASQTTLAAILASLGSAVMQATGGTIGLVAGSALIGSFKLSDGTSTAIVCDTPFSFSTASTAIIIPLCSGKQIYICSLTLVNSSSGSAQLVSIIEGTGSSCAGGTPRGMWGNTTASMGFAAGGGMAPSAGHPINATATVSQNVCVAVGGSTNVSGGGMYACR